MMGFEHLLLLVDCHRAIDITNSFVLLHFGFLLSPRAYWYCFLLELRQFLFPDLLLLRISEKRQAAGALSTYRNMSGTSVYERVATLAA